MNQSTQLNAGGLVGCPLNAAEPKELPTAGTKLVLYWNDYSGLGHPLIEGLSLVAEGQKFVEVEVTGVKTAKVSFD
jgi:hypothetical protein